jgi:hypothetical protein
VSHDIFAGNFKRKFTAQVYVFIRAISAIFYGFLLDYINFVLDLHITVLPLLVMDVFSMDITL